MRRASAAHVSVGPGPTDALASSGHALARSAALSRSTSSIALQLPDDMHPVATTATYTLALRISASAHKTSTWRDKIAPAQARARLTRDRRSGGRASARSARRVLHGSER